MSLFYECVNFDGLSKLSAFYVKLNNGMMCSHLNPAFKSRGQYMDMLQWMGAQDLILSLSFFSNSFNLKILRLTWIFKITNIKLLVWINKVITSVNHPKGQNQCHQILLIELFYYMFKMYRKNYYSCQNSMWIYIILITLYFLPF